MAIFFQGRSASNPGNKSKIFTILGCWFLGLTIILCIPITYLILNPPADELPSNATALDMTETPSNATVFYGHEKENADGSPKQLELLLFDPAGEHSSDIEKHRVTRGVAKFAGKALGIMLGVILFIVLCAICGCCLCCFKVHRIILGKHKEHQVQGHRASLQYMVGNGDGVYSGQGAQPIYPPQQGYQPPPPPYQAHNNQGYGSQNPYPNQTQYSNNYPNNQPSAPIGFEGLQR
ncbi:unnamed protein product [Notodromas monacha]|uniref:Uncharacterized protein n=1 Tax=Notodromas monacha TaxID=399045 RepID=A0A7R9BNW6_9CRUS|nr:unnamed protein product [Notodromas monacha]CAG0917612.1 unnamed protein product [Notodromas monacha]